MTSEIWALFQNTNYNHYTEVNQERHFGWIQPEFLLKQKRSIENGFSIQIVQH